MQEKIPVNFVRIACPNCEWDPISSDRWTCECGQSFDTFQNRGRCPSCSKQHVTTQCLACRKISPHADWHWTSERLKNHVGQFDPVIRERKLRLEGRLIDLGIRNNRVSYLPVLEYNEAFSKSPQQVGCRMMILFAITQITVRPSRRKNIVKWLKSENIWDQASPDEQRFLSRLWPSIKVRKELSRSIEGSLALAWSLGLISNLPTLEADSEDSKLPEFRAAVPEIGESLAEFLSQLSFRSTSEIGEERLLNEIVTAEGRDAFISGRTAELQVDISVSYWRFRSFNWLLTSFPVGDKEHAGLHWDNVDLST